MLAEGVKVLSSDLEAFSTKQSTLAHQMNREPQSKLPESEASGPDDEGPGGVQALAQKLSTSVR